MAESLVGIPLGMLCLFVLFAGAARLHLVPMVAFLSLGALMITVCFGCMSNA